MSSYLLVFLTVSTVVLSQTASQNGQATPAVSAIDIGTRLELLVDDYLIDSSRNVQLRLHKPVEREVVFEFDRPWEGNTSAYVTVFRDGDIFRMYYRGSQHADGKALHQVTCYAESKDGIHWKRPQLGLFEFNGSKANNIIWTGPGSHNFTPFKDTNPNCPPDQRYKALGTGDAGLLAFKSADGIHWSLLSEEPVITKGAFDSQNLAFWDSVRGCYVEYHRGFREGFRDIMTSTSPDFLHWTDPQWLEYPGAPREHLYTNAITPYYRAPHILMGFPKRFFPTRTRHVLADQPPGVSDAVFMTSRDGLVFHRWTEAWIRPGLRPERWICRNNMVAWGILVTKSDIPSSPEELSFYILEGYYSPNGCRLRRATLRIDGFVSAYAPLAGGEFTTKPIVFSGTQLVLNYSTSAAGGIRVEIQDASGEPIPGFTLGDCVELFGDAIEETVIWGNQKDLSALAGKPVRLHFLLRDADLFSFRFK